MRKRTSSISLGLICLTLLAFGYGIWKIVEWQQDASVVPRERTTTATVTVTYSRAVSTDKGRWSNGGRYVYSYYFLLDGHLYTGVETGTKTYDSHIGFPFEPSQHTTQTAYFDADNPSTNSLTEFGEKSSIDMRNATVSLLGGFLLIAVVFGLTFLDSRTNAQGAAIMAAVEEVPVESVEKQPSMQDFMSNLEKIREREKQEKQSDDVSTY